MDAATASHAETGLQEVVGLDAAAAGTLRSLGALLLRTESVASSKIERIDASAADYARALHGSRANSAAVSMVAATVAMGQLMDDVTAKRELALDAVLAAHHRLMVDDPSDSDFAGRLRTMQNWVGGSDHSPLGALYVPPPPDTVKQYLDDVLAFTNRNDLPVLVQAAIAHAQFESIHPFTDGNGRIGRALINAVFRRRGATSGVVVPVASALVARRDRYFDALTAYRAGDLEPLLTSFITATAIAAAESRVTAERLSAEPERWRGMVGAVRSHSAVVAVLGILPANPILTAADAITLLGTPPAGVYAALTRLHDAGVLRPLTSRTRDQIWGAGAILDELDELNARIGLAAR